MDPRRSRSRSPSRQLRAARSTTQGARTTSAIPLFSIPRPVCNTHPLASVDLALDAPTNARAQLAGGGSNSMLGTIHSERGGRLLLRQSPQWRRTKPPSAPIPVGGDVQMAKLVRKVIPEYPAIARAARISGIVRLIGTIGKDGTIRESATGQRPSDAGARRAGSRAAMGLQTDLAEWQSRGSDRADRSKFHSGAVACDLLTRRSCTMRTGNKAARTKRKPEESVPKYAGAGMEGCRCPGASRAKPETYSGEYARPAAPGRK